MKRFVCIDWSGEAVEHPKGIAVAEAIEGEAAPRLLGQRWSRQGVLDWLVEQSGAKADLIVGMDFSFSLPFLDRGAFFPNWSESPTDARSLWTLVEDLTQDDPHLGCQSFVAHIEAARHFRRHGLGTGDLFGSGGGRLRRTEIACREAGLGSAQSCFNLVGAAQVGKSSLTGMRLLHRLDAVMPIWPFDPRPSQGPVLVEMYTTIAARAAGLRGRSKVRDAATLDTALAALGSAPHEPLLRYDDHSTDALLGAAWLRRISHDPTLWRQPESPIRETEGWTFGVP